LEWVYGPAFPSRTPFALSHSCDIGGAQYEVWKHTDLIVDVVPGRGGMFSLDDGREKRFLVRSEICAVTPGPV
jgi:uncharacterized protein (DUF779 family)